jgi:hypothetical protein
MDTNDVVYTVQEEYSGQEEQYEIKKPAKKKTHRSTSQKERSRKWFQKKIEERKAALATKKEIAIWWSLS